MTGLSRRACRCLPLAILLCSTLAEARTIEVGRGREFPLPGPALAQARPGDLVHIAAGQYFDCGFVAADRVTIAGDGPSSVLTDKTCGGKALLVIDGADVTVRDLTLQRARVVDGNGAGIRAEGGSLTVEGVRFINNQNGILTADNPDAVVRVLHSEFTDNGACLPGGGCAHGIYAGNIKLLHVEDSHFLRNKDGHYIKSRAQRTEIVDDTIEDGPDGAGSYLIDVPNGGSLVVEGCTMEKGPNASNHAAAISIGEEGVDRPTDEIIVKDNRFRNDMSHPTSFLRNITATSAELVGNTLTGQVRPLEGDGSLH